MYYINIFFIYSFLGYIFENIYSFITHSHFNSGILYGPCTFIYGIAIYIIMVLNRFLKQFKLNKWLEVLLFYIGACIIMTLVEFTGGNLIEKLLHVQYWNYQNMRFNYGPYISLEASLFWGVFATLVNYLLAPKIKKIAKKIPSYLTITFIILFIIDILVVIFN